MTVDAMALECKGLSKTYGDVPAVVSFDLQVRRGQVLALLGPSGCGKTTALRLISGFDLPNGGEIFVGGEQVLGHGCNVPPEKRRVGIVFQEGVLFPHLNVSQNIGYGLADRKGRQRRVEEMLELVGLAGMERRMPHELSGGQQQRVALARALAPSPEVLLLDEPFSNLDPGLREQVRRDVLKILRQGDITAVFVTHDQEEALFVGDSVAVMNEGRVEQVGPPESIFHCPDTRFVAHFIGTADFIPAWRQGDSLVSEVGCVPFPICEERDGRLEVLVRPDCLDLRPGEAGPGIIEEREFRGAFYLYRVGLPSGRSVRCLLSHVQEYAKGTPVDVALRAGHTLRPFVDGRAIAV
jgi:iron(III) transport system ATP-binding protein